MAPVALQDLEVYLNCILSALQEYFQGTMSLDRGCFESPLHYVRAYFRAPYLLVVGAEAWSQATDANGIESIQ